MAAALDEAQLKQRIKALEKALSDVKKAEKKKAAHLARLEHLEKINRIIQKGTDAEQILDQVFSRVLDIFDCDRVWLLFPCDPESESWHVPIEKTRPEYPGAFQRGKEFSMTPDAAKTMAELLDKQEPVFGTLSPGQTEYDAQDQFHIRAYLLTAVYPKVGKPWEFGLHQCDHPREWTKEEISLFKEISIRIEDALSMLLLLTELRDRESFLKILLDRIPIPVYYKDTNGCYLGFNKAFQRFYGKTQEEMIGKTVLEVTDQAGAAEYHASDLALFKTGGHQEMETRVENTSGDVRDVILNKTVYHNRQGEVSGMIGAILDITERKQSEKERQDLQNQLMQKQKMESLGNLAGGIAHDFNNILSPIIGMSELLLEDLAPESQPHENAREIFKAGRRGSDLVKQILAFSHQSELQLGPVRIQQVLNEVVSLIRAIMPSYIEVDLDIQQNCRPVMADSTQIHQVAMNIITNAYHALDDKGGTIQIRLKETRATEDLLSVLPPETEWCVALTISDTGQGMPKEVISRIFDPYFTTKPQGKGTGLGLSVVYGIIRKLGGDIRVSSEPGKGTTMRILLPLMPDLARTDDETIPTVSRIAGRAHILFVDDEQAIIKLNKQMLERTGYKVTACHDGVQALELFKKDPHGIDIVISDMAMPHMSGSELVSELRAVRPDIPVIICTGFSNRMNKKKAAESNINGFLIKPATRSELIKKIEAVLESATHPDA